MGCERLLVQVESPRPMTDDELYQKLLEVSFQFVSFRPRSEQEIQEFLTKKLVKHKISNAPVVEKVIARLKDYGYLDDHKFAQWWISQRQSFRPKGRAVLMQELALKGISRNLIKEILADLGSSDELKMALLAVTKKLQPWQRLSVRERQKKLYNFLGRRGFNSETIQRAIDELGKTGYT